MSTALANPAEMIAHGAPRVIHNDEELEEYTAALFRLTALENPSLAEQEAIELLTLLVERYEQEHFPVDLPDPVGAIKFRAFNSRLLRGLPRSLSTAGWEPKIVSPVEL